MATESEEASCPHVGKIDRHVKPKSNGCEECLAMGDTWVHLRFCKTCGHVGCCDDSKNKHATKHFHHTKHSDHSLTRARGDMGLVFPCRRGCLRSSPLISSSSSARCMSCTQIAPSPTAAATRFVLPARASPTAKTPGIVVSKKRRAHERPVPSARSSARRSAPVLMKPLSSSRTQPFSQAVRVGARHHEDVADRQRLAHARVDVPAADASEPRLALERLDDGAWTLTFEQPPIWMR